HPARVAMACLFSGRVLIRNNSDQDELDTEAELSRRLENRLVLLFFGAGSCPKCQAFAPILRDFFVQLTDEFYVDMPKKWLFLPFEDDLRSFLLPEDLEDPAPRSLTEPLRRC
ncbi:hypothetical protein E2I00_018682, partial [Balaenoptera physalus]